MSNDNITDLVNKLGEVTSAFTSDVASVKKSMQQLNDTTQELVAGQKKSIKQLSAYNIKPIERSLSSGNPQEQRTNDEIVNMVRQLKEKDLARLIDVTKKSFEMTGQKIDNALDEKKVLNEYGKKIAAIMKGQEVMIGAVTDNPNLRRIKEMHTAMQEMKKDARHGKIATKMEDWGNSSNNPIAKMFGGIGKSINTARTIKANVGDAYSYFLGGGRQAAKSEKQLELNRRKQLNDAPLLNAYVSKEKDINNQLKNKSLSDSQREELKAELASLSQKRKDVQSRMQSRSSLMAEQAYTTMAYHDQRLNKKQYKEYGDDKKYVLEALKKDIAKSFNTPKQLNGNIDNSNGKKTFKTLMESTPQQLQPGKTFKQTMDASLDGNSIAALRVQRDKLFAANRSSSDPELRSIMAQLATKKGPSKILSGNGLQGDSPISTSVVPQLGKNTFKGVMDKGGLLASVIKENTETPKTFGEHISSMSASLRSIAHQKQTPMPNITSNEQKEGGIFSKMVGPLIAAVAGGAIAFGGQKLLASAGVGDGTAGGNIADDSLLKGGRVLANAGSRKVMASVGKDVTMGAAKKALVHGGVKEGGKIASKAVGKSLAKKIPFLGAGMGALFAGQRMMDGDFVGGGLELASGVASIFPGIGTAISVVLDASLAARDVAKSVKKEHANNKTQNAKQQISLQSTSIDRKYDDAKYIEAVAVANAKAIENERLNGLGKKVALRDAELNSKTLGTAIVG